MPNRAYLNDIERYLRLIEDDGSNDLDFILCDGLFSVHPLVLCTLAAFSDVARAKGGNVTVRNLSTNSSTRYLQRMGLFEAMGIESGIPVIAHEPAGRFIPLTRVKTNSELNNFIVDFVPLLHASPDEAASVKYVLYELVRNVLEHSASPGGAFVAAQVARKSGRLLVAVADAGIGVRKSISFAHPVGSDRDGITLAFRPGITGTTPAFGGNETNGGAGLFFMKAMATMAHHHMVMMTGESMMKLLTQPRKRPIQINANLAQDRVNWRHLDPTFVGTAVGIDITVDEFVGFGNLLSEIRNVYQLRVKETRKTKYRAQFK